MSISTATVLLDSTDISANGNGTARTGFSRYKGLYGLINVTAVPTGGAPTLDVYVQATPDGGATWQDVAHFQFTTSAVARLFQLSQIAAGGTTTIAPSDAALAGDSVVQGPFGDQLRVKYKFAAGGSSGSYTLAVTGVLVGGF